MINLELLRSCGTIKNYQTDTMITLEGEMGQEMFFILFGKVGIFINTFTDDAVKIAEIGSGEIFGEMSLLDNLPRSATAIALEPMSALVIDKKNFDHLLSVEPEIALKIMRALSSRLRMTNNKLLHSEKPDEISNAITKTTVEDSAVAKQIALFPPEHKTYSYTPDFNCSEYIFEKQVTCPICGNKFAVNIQRLSKLRSRGIDNDLRKRFENFDPLWFNLWTCSKCYYTNYYHEFLTVSEVKYQLINEKLNSIMHGQKLNFSNDRNINQLFAQYYLALNCAIAMSVPNMKLGKIWMNLLWLYRDCQDDEMVKISSEEALKYYLDAYMKCDTDMKPEGEQQLCLILGELYNVLGKMDDALKYLMSARTRNGGSRTFSSMAENRIEELRKSKLAL